MIEKQKLLEKIDDAIKDESTSPKNKELLEKVRPELVNAKNKEQYLNVALKIASIIGALAKIVKIFTSSG